MYNYRNSKANIINALKSKTPIEKTNKIPRDEEFTYENGILCWVGSIFIDIENSTELFYSKDEKLARLLRAFNAEVITILQNKDEFSQIGIRGDCVYGIYSTPYKSDLVELFRIAYCLNTFLRMFNAIIKNYGYKPINAGIGLGCDQDLVIKVGRTGTGINDKVWIGKAVVDASNYSSIAGRNGIGRIVLSNSYYDNIHEILEKENPKYKQWLEPKMESYYDNSIEYYHCNIIQTDFDNWIDGGMKDIE